MKFYTKITSVILFVCLLFSMTACGVSKPDFNSKETAPATTENTEPATEAPTEPSTEEPTEEDEDKAFSAGTVEGSTYTNDFVGISCALGDGWTIATKEQIAQQMGLVDVLISDEDVIKQIENSSTAMIFMANKNDGTGSINITAGDTTSYLTALVNQKTIVDTVVAQLPDILTASGMEVIECGTEDMMFCGEENYGIRSNLTFSGISIHQRQIILVKGTYTITITVSTYSQDITQALLDLFTAL